MIIGQKLAIIIIVLFSTAMSFAPSFYAPIEEEKNVLIILPNPYWPRNDERR